MRVDRVEKKYWTRSSNEFSSKIGDHFQKRRQSTLKINAKKKKLADQRNFCCQSIPDLLHQQLKLGKNPWILLAPASDDHRYITVPMLDVLRKKWRDFQKWWPKQRHLGNGTYDVQNWKNRTCLHRRYLQSSSLLLVSQKETTWR